MKEEILDCRLLPSFGDVGLTSELTRFDDVGDKEDTVRRKLHCRWCEGDGGVDRDSGEVICVESSSETP
jgi:hypothetical protein